VCVLVVGKTKKVSPFFEPKVLLLRQPHTHNIFIGQQEAHLPPLP